MNKAGSTTLQSAYRDFDDGRTAMVRLGPPNHSGAMVNLFSKRKWNYHLNRFAQRTPEDIAANEKELRDKLVAQFQKDPQKNFMISGEDMSNVFDAEDAQAMVGFLKEHFDEVRGLGYIRDLESYLPSEYSERLKIVFEHPAILQLYPWYRRRFESWETALGRENLTYRLFTPKHFVNEDLIDDFAQWAGISPASPKNRRASNSKMSAEAVAIYFVYRKARGPLAQNPWQVPKHGHVLGKMAEFGNTRFVLDFGGTWRALAKFADDIDWIEGRLGCPVTTEPGLDGTAVRFASGHEIEVCAPPLVEELCRFLGVAPDLTLDWHGNLLAAMDQAYGRETLP